MLSIVAGRARVRAVLMSMAVRMRNFILIEREF